MPLTEDKAAKIITSAFRELIAKKGYKRMASGSSHRAMKLGNIKEFREISHNNLANLRRIFFSDVGHLNDNETKIFERIVNIPLAIIHFSPEDLRDEKNKDVVKIFSRELLEKKGIKFDITHSHPIDLESLADDDFVFFSLISSVSFRRPGSRFGAFRHFCEVDDNFFRSHRVVVTIDDYAFINPVSQLPKILVDDSLFLQLIPQCFRPTWSKIRAHFKRLLTSELSIMNLGFSIRYHLFMEGDILPGLALLVLLMRRLLLRVLWEMEPELEKEQKEVVTVLKKNLELQLTDEYINLLLNFTIRPIVKIPRFLITDKMQVGH